MSQFHANPQTGRRKRHALGIFGLVLTLCAALSTTGCTTYIPYAVQHVPGTQPDQGYPELDPKPILEGRDFAVFRSSQDNLRLFVTPTSLIPVASSNGRVLCTSIERTDGRRLILTCALGPATGLLDSVEVQLRGAGVAFNKLSFYPADSLTLRPLSDPRRPNSLRITAQAGPPASLMTFSALLVMQVDDPDSVLPFKKLVESPAGLIVEGTFSLTAREGVRSYRIPRSLQLLVSDIEVTNLTM